MTKGSVISHRKQFLFWGVAVTCKHCGGMGEVWEEHPSRLIACPICEAEKRNRVPAGSGCLKHPETFCWCKEQNRAESEDSADKTDERDE